MKDVRFTDTQIMGLLRQAKGGLAMLELCRNNGIISVIFDKWCAKYDGIDASMMSQMSAARTEASG